MICQGVIPEGRIRRCARGVCDVPGVLYQRDAYVDVPEGCMCDMPGCYTRGTHM